ncbi:DUF551 domain-containing protein [Acinetobacter baumannii]|uniref:hypothetical protein n=1 Tax=Acinetobacter baumannii TaxID=470 RepID=UPI00385E4194
MTDLNKERELFEATRVGEFKNVEFVVNEHWPEGHYVGKTSHYEDQDDAHYLSQSWYSWIDRAKIEAKAQAVPTWIGVKDEEPPTDTMVLICWSDSPDVQPEIDYMTCDEDLNHIWANFYKDPPTHWMHFHKVPSESGAEQ